MLNKFITFASIIFIWVTALFFISGCEKDEISTSSTELETEVLTRSANTDIIFYRGSLTTDNYLISSNRVYQIYNKSKLLNIQFIATGQPNINVNGVLLRHYKLLITYTDSTSRQITAYSKSSSASFTFTPTGANLLSDSHTSKFLELSQNSTSNGYSYNFWRDTQIASKTWDIKKDGVTLITTKVIDPINKNSNIFMPPHAH